jgi:hypothetical protein
MSIIGTKDKVNTVLLGPWPEKGTRGKLFDKQTADPCRKG